MGGMFSTAVPYKQEDSWLKYQQEARRLEMALKNHIQEFEKGAPCNSDNQMRFNAIIGQIGIVRDMMEKCIIVFDTNRYERKAWISEWKLKIVYLDAEYWGRYKKKLATIVEDEIF